MKMYALVMIMLLAIAGCTTTYKGSIKGASDQNKSTSNEEVVGQSNQIPAKP